MLEVKHLVKIEYENIEEIVYNMIITVSLTFFYLKFIVRLEKFEKEKIEIFSQWMQC